LKVEFEQPQFTHLLVIWNYLFAIFAMSYNV
jgi:hypothetical protein